MDVIERGYSPMNKATQSPAYLQQIKNRYYESLPYEEMKRDRGKATRVKEEKKEVGKEKRKGRDRRGIR
jgi:hypothetical protein